MKTKYPLVLPAACRRWLSALPLLLVLIAAPLAQADTLVFDNVSNFRNGVAGASGASTSSTPNTFMGDGFALLSGTQNISGFDLYPVNASGTNFTGIKITVYVWQTVNTSGTVNATTPAFSNLLNSYTATFSGSFTTGFYYPLESASPGVTPGFVLGTPLTISGTQIGLTFNYQGTTDGVTYNNVNSLTSLITYGTPPTVGSNVFSGYYRNANSETNGNFTSALRTLGNANESLGVRVYSTSVVPEPATWAMMVGGVGMLVFVQRFRRARKA
ncbi:MAG: PEP-CTERM sorting domain-containing protein [Chthoniobacterales bacterium]